MAVKKTEIVERRGKKMRATRMVMGTAFIVLTGSSLFSQTPVLGNIEAPYANLQSSVKIGGVTFGAGAVSYGAPGTPLIVTGSNLGGSGTVQFLGYKNGAPDPGYTVQATVSMWSSTMLFLTVPSGATSGMVTVTVGENTSNGLPFVVTPGNYSGSCPASPPNNQLQITTSSLHDGTAGQAYSATLGAEGGTTPYAWTLIGGTFAKWAFDEFSRCDLRNADGGRRPGGPHRSSFR